MLVPCVWCSIGVVFFWPALLTPAQRLLSDADHRNCVRLLYATRDLGTELSALQLELEFRVQASWVSKRGRCLVPFESGGFGGFPGFGWLESGLRTKSRVIESEFCPSTSVCEPE
jgi:hypothetical protein